MKKAAIVLLLLIICLCFTGCGSSKCTMTVISLKVNEGLSETVEAAEGEFLFEETFEISEGETVFEDENAHLKVVKPEGEETYPGEHFRIDRIDRKGVTVVMGENEMTYSYEAEYMTGSILATDGKKSSYTYKMIFTR